MARNVNAFKAACQGGSIPQWTGFAYDMMTAEAATLVRERIQVAQEGTGASFAIVDEDDNLLGSAGLLSIDWQRSLGIIAYWLAPQSRGRGDATRAVSTLCEWAFDTVGLARLELRADLRNEQSWRVAQRVDFQREGIVRSSQRSRASDSTSTSRSCQQTSVSPHARLRLRHDSQPKWQMAILCRGTV